MADSAKLTTGSVAGHLVRQTTPTALGVAAIMSIGVIDAYFVGQIGPDQLAAISFIFPVGTALASLGVGVIAGVGSVVSRALGSGKTEDARQVANFGVLLSCIIGLVVGTVLFALRMPLFRLLQADAELLPLIDSYMRPYALGFPLLLASMGINGALRGQGAAARSTGILLTFSITNWVLDPLLIRGGFGLPAFGIAGAAYATVIGWALGTIVGFGLLQTSTLPFSFSSLRGADWKNPAWRLARVAGPASFSNSINPIGLAVLTSLLATQGQAAVAGFGVGGRLQTMAVVPLLGLSGSIGAIIGQNWGAQEYDRTRRAILQAGGFCLCYGLTAALVLFLGREWFASRFSDDPAVIAAAVRYLEISVWGYAGYGVLIAVNGALNAIDRAPVALGLSLGRVLLVMVPFALLLRDSWGAEAMFGAELASNIAGAIAGVAIAVWVFGSADRSRRVARSAPA